MEKKGEQADRAAESRNVSPPEVGRRIDQFDDAARE